MNEPAPSARPTRRTDVPVGVIVVAMAIAVWWPAFTLGAWHEPFFDQLLTIWAAATAAAVFVVFQRQGWWWRTWRAVILLLPSVWLGLSFAIVDESMPATVVIVDLIAVAAVLLGFPFTLWTLARIMWPDMGNGMTARAQWFVVLIVGTIAVISFTLGLNNAAFMTCEDFSLSGNSEPPGCVHLDAAASVPLG